MLCQQNNQNTEIRSGILRSDNWSHNRPNPTCYPQKKEKQNWDQYGNNEHL
jgi:hypothetical protein